MIMVWYLFMLPYEFMVNFTVRTVPGDIIQTIRIWDRKLDNTEITEVDSVHSVTQRINWQNRTYVYTWNFLNINDTTTDVKVKITQPGRALLNKFLVPLTEQNIETDARKIAGEFYDVLKIHLKITDVKVVGEVETKAVFCACRTLNTNQIEKANGMMKDYGLLTSFISQANLKTDGPPIVKVTKWSHTRGKLEYDFCFPVVKADSLPPHDSITYKEFKRQKALQAVYHGNYITSDRAWYALIRFAESHGYQIDGLPIEYFYDNPNLGLNESKWKAEVFLPIR